MIRMSNYHTEIDISRYYNHDKIIVGEYLKQRIKSYSIDSFTNLEESNNKRFHLVVLLVVIYFLKMHNMQ